MKLHFEIKNLSGIESGSLEFYTIYVILIRFHLHDMDEPILQVYPFPIW